MKFKILISNIQVAFATIFLDHSKRVSMHQRAAFKALFRLCSRRYMDRLDKPESDVRLVELGCGTGRFMTYVKDNFPLMQATALDLSPFYLEQARQNIEYWRELRQPGLQVGGYKGTGVTFMH